MEQKRLLLSGEFVSPAADRIRVSELADDHRKSRVKSLSWRESRTTVHCAVHVVPAFGKPPPSSASDREAPARD
jgi:hypothetical protein